jgi:ferric enterobactin receptor
MSLMLVTVSLGAAAQSGGKGNGKITGRIQDAANQDDVPFATIALTKPGSETPIDGTVADESGKFTISKIAPGEYNLIISFIGYQSKTVSKVVISDKKDQLDMGTIQISPTIQELKEVTVEAQKDLFEEKVDRTVYNAEVDASNRGGDAADVLRKVPTLTVDLDGNVSLRGSQNIRVLINNRPSTITAGSVADALKQIPADQIKSVEVITSPSSRYDAEGSTGIINIILKKNNLEGFSLNVDAGAGVRGSNLGLNGSYRKGKMGFSLGGFGRAGYNIRGAFENQQRTIGTDSETGSPLELLNTQYADTRNRMMFGRYTLGWDYDINKNNFLNASIQYGIRNMNNFQDNLLTQSFRNGSLINSGIRDVNVADFSGTVDVNVGYTRTFAKPQQELSILGQYSRNDRSNEFINRILNADDLSVASRLRNENPSNNQETTIQLDYQTPIAKNQLIELGGKQILRQVTSDFRTFFAQGADGAYQPIQNALLANVLNYNQNVTGGYLSYTLTTKQNYSLKAGVRYEYTTIDANFQEGEEVLIPSYGALVPSVNLSKRLKNGNTVKAAYNRRLQRPSLQFLNPNVQAANPLNITIGNPELDPEFTDNIELGYSTFIKGTSLNFTAFYRNTANAIQSVRDVLGQDTIRTTFQNIGQENAYGMSIFANIKIGNNLMLNGGGDVYYAVLTNNVPDPLFNASNQGWVMSYRAFGSYNLGNGWALQGFGFFRGRQVQLQGYQGGFGIYSLNVRKDFANKKGSIGIGAENFLHSAFRIRTELNSPVIDQRSVMEMRNQNLKVNFSYRIGKVATDNNTRRRRKSISNDDMKEGGDNGAGAVQQQGAPAGGMGGAPAGGGAPAQRPAGQGAPGQGAPAQPGQGQGQWQRNAPGQGQQPGSPAGQPQLSNQEQPGQEQSSPENSEENESGETPETPANESEEENN